MANKNIETRRRVNRTYYERQMATPEGREKRKKYRTDYYRANAQTRRDTNTAYYERNRREIIFKAKLWTMLLRVRRGVIERGGVPFDG